MKIASLVLCSLLFCGCCFNTKPEPPVERVGIVRDLQVNNFLYTIIFESDTYGIESFPYIALTNTAPPVWKDLKCKITLSDKANNFYRQIKVIRSE